MQFYMIFVSILKVKGKVGTTEIQKFYCYLYVQICTNDNAVNFELHIKLSSGRMRGERIGAHFFIEFCSFLS